jgi:hypothetical protein
MRRVEAASGQAISHSVILSKLGMITSINDTGHVSNTSTPSARSGRELRKSFSLERFSQSMTGTSGLEAPGAIFYCGTYHLHDTADLQRVDIAWIPERP